MTLFLVFAAVAALCPAAGLALSSSQRRWIPSAAAAVSLCAAGAAFLFAPDALRMPWAAAGGAFAAAALYVRRAASRAEVDREALKARVDSKDSQRRQIVENLKAAKLRCRDIEIEQREVLALYGMVKGLSEAMTWDELKPKLESAVQQYLRVEAFAIYVLSDPSDAALTPLLRRGLGNSLGSSWETIDRHLQERAVSRTVPHVIEAPDRAVALPVFESGTLMGYFYARIPKDWDPEKLLSKAQAFVDEISFAFQRIRLFQEVDKGSRIDGLTGVFRRGVLDEKLAEEVVRAQTFKTSFCLMILDVDHFKSLNDNYGHPFGDAVLQRVGAVLRESVYETDFVARYGGEEFAILLPRAEPEGVLRKADSIRRAIAAERFELAMKQISITISIGVAHYPRDGMSAEAIVRQADQALYRAKETGRDRVVDISELRKAK